MKIIKTKASFKSDQEGRRFAEVPLLVHRRCQKSTFTISSDIAYDGKMNPAPKPKNSGSVRQLFGASCWFDTDGAAERKWCSGEGEIVVHMLRRIAGAGIAFPDIFVITAFKIVE